ncbi:MAG TPA: acetyl-CoA carboxylase, carboxyltransferase subunit beta [Kofleriaceae bacterium]|nr:acetyl-CoA carboxylase, carboxyltransferase subunit beta [Kofleriaceae bacterium]
MSWWSREKGLAPEPKKSVPKGLWIKCDSCSDTLYERDLDANLRVCPACGYHFRLGTAERMALLIDEGSFEEVDDALESVDPLEFRVEGKRYRDGLKAAAKKSGTVDAYRAGRARIGGHPVEIGFFVFEFMGGSMGSVVGEKIARQFERAVEARVPAMVFSASGGARMQEGTLSLMQLAKTAAARSLMREAHVPYISVLLHPTTGGVAASFAMLGDIIITEPDALIGFAGPRVIEQTIRQQLPPGFQRAEFLLEHGMVDMVVERHKMKSTLARTLRWFAGAGGDRWDGVGAAKNGTGASKDGAGAGTEGAGAKNGAAKGPATNGVR